MSEIKKEKTKSPWQNIKKILGRCSENDLVGIIAELYSLSKSNKDFLESRFLKDNKAFERYKEKITRYLMPDFNNPFNPERTVSLKQAKQILSDYKKASGNKIMLLDLMIHYIETGVDFSNKMYGLYSAYYSSLQSVFTDSLKLMKSFSFEEIEPFFHRMEIIVKKSKNTGDLFHESVSLLLHQSYPDLFYSEFAS